MEKERALEIVKKHYSPDGVDDTLRIALETLIPELAESEDERTRKFLLGYVIDMIAGLESDISRSTYDGIKGHDPDAEAELTQWEKARGYLEKRKEQKPSISCGHENDTEWGNQDEHNLNSVINLVHATTDGAWGSVIGVQIENWLKSLPERFNLQSQQEWSEEDDMETINVFRPLAGTSIESATKQAVNKFTNSGKKFLLAFNGVFILIDNTKSVQDIVSEYNRSLGGKKKEQVQSEGEPNDFEIRLEDCMFAAQQYPQGKIGRDVVKKWAEELSDYCPQPKPKWDEFDEDCLKRAIWYVENPAPSVIKDSRLALWLNTLRSRFFLKPQPKVEWSEDDGNTIESIKGLITTGRFADTNTIRTIWKLLDSLRPSWKPSEEQMEALRNFSTGLFVGDGDCDALRSLYEQLKEIR